MLVNLPLMPRMVMVVGSVLSGVTMVVNLGPLAMAVFMKVLMRMFVGMGVGMLVAMFLPIVGVFVRVSMGMLMIMQMLMFVFSFHFKLLETGNSKRINLEYPNSPAPRCQLVRQIHEFNLLLTTRLVSRSSFGYRHRSSKP